MGDSLSSTCELNTCTLQPCCHASDSVLPCSLSNWQNKHWIAPLKCAVLLDLALLSLIPKLSQLFNVAYRKGGVQCHVIIVSSPDPPISAVLDVLHHQHVEDLGRVWRLLHGFCVL